MKNKSLGFWFAAAAGCLSLLTLILIFIYGGQGGQVASLVGEKPWTDFTGIIGAVLLAFALMTVLHDGIWNIAEAMNGIRMIGIPELAGMNYTIAVVNLLAILAAVVTCFMRKSKEA